MFTGLVEGRAPVVELTRNRSGGRLWIGAPELERGSVPWKPAPGESLSLSGCCLTVAARGRGGRTAFDLSRETLARTWLGALEPGKLVNVERALRVADRLGGHLVAGHVDAVGHVREIRDSRDRGRLFTFEVPRGFERWLIEKGSVSVDGISLTVLAPRARRFGVAVIPETLRRTTLGLARVGDPVHLEGDLIGKWVAKVVRTPRRARS
jgi:riboflavin synthase